MEGKCKGIKSVQSASIMRADVVFLYHFFIPFLICEKNIFFICEKNIFLICEKNFIFFPSEKIVYYV